MSITEKIDLKQEEDMQRIGKLRLFDDGFFTACFEGHKESTELVLRIILDKSDLTVEDVRTKVFMQNILDRSVQLDILATDSGGKKYNIEIQRASQGAGRKRARYYSSVIDTHLLQKSRDFKELPETYVIFITEKDVMNGGKPVYHFERCIPETGELFEDGSHILYVNGKLQNDTPLGKLMHDFFCTDPSEMYYDVLADRVRFFKETKEGMTIMGSVVEEMKMEARREEKLIQQKKTALRMLEAGKYAPEEISDISGMALDEVMKLKAGQPA